MKLGLDVEIGPRLGNALGASPTNVWKRINMREATEIKYNSLICACITYHMNKVCRMVFTCRYVRSFYLKRHSNSRHVSEITK